MAAVWNTADPDRDHDRPGQLDAENAAADHLQGGTMRIKMGTAGKMASRQSSRALAAILPGGQ
jgi:hypothetical protein